MDVSGLRVGNRFLYDTKGTIQITGIKRSNIYYWVDQGIVEPELKSRRGRKRLYSDENIMEFLIANDLSNKGCSLRLMRICLSGLRADRKVFADFLSPKQLKNEENQVYLLVSESDISSKDKDVFPKGSKPISYSTEVIMVGKNEPFNLPKELLSCRYFAAINLTTLFNEVRDKLMK